MEFSIEKFVAEAQKANKSESYIAHYTQYADRLQQRGLPVLFDIGHLAHNMGIPKDRLLAIARNKDYYYYLMPKKSGGMRRIIVPNDDLKEVQRWINKKILQAITPLDCVTGFVCKKSILHNAKIHENKRYILNLDMKDFFESITRERVERLFFRLGYRQELAIFMADICTTILNKEYIQWKLGEDRARYFDSLMHRREPFLVQGAPTSPSIANLICYGMDKKLMKYAEQHGINYSRYADDITFSSDDISRLPKMGYIKHLMEEEHFALNEDKTRLLKNGMRQEVTGLLINGRVRVPRAYKKDIYRHLHFCLKYGGLGHFRRIRSQYKMSREWLLGRIFYVNAVEPKEAQKMLCMFNQVDWLKE